VNNFLGNISRTVSGVAIAAALILIFGGPLSPLAQARPAGQGAAATGNAAAGKSIFTAQKCASCHGNDGQGGNGDTAGPQIMPLSLAMANFAEVLRNPRDPMPPFSTQDISNAQLADLYAFLKSGTAAPAQASAPAAGNAQNGNMLYTKIGCYECHNRDGSGGGAGPRLAPNPLPWAAFSKQVRLPVNAMPPYTTKVLSDADLADIYAFVQTFPKPPAITSIPLLQQ